MKRVLAMMLAVFFCLLSACSSGPSSNRYIGSAETGTTLPDKTESSTYITNVDPDSTDPGVVRQESGAEDEDSSTSASMGSLKAKEENRDTKEGQNNQDDKTKPEPSESDSSKPALSSNSSQAAKQNNELANKAAVGSILDKTGNNTEIQSTESELGKSLKQIRELLKQLKTETEAENAEKVKELATEIMTAWSSSQVTVQAAYPEMETFIQQKMDTLSELIKAESIDLGDMLQLDYELYQAIRQLADNAGV